MKGYGCLMINDIYVPIVIEFDHHAGARAYNGDNGSCPADAEEFEITSVRLENGTDIMGFINSLDQKDEMYTDIRKQCGENL
jgi:hypothetical protein